MITELSRADQEAFEPEAKIGLLATRNPEGLPHLTLITSLTAAGPTRLVFGQFSEGLSKVHPRGEPRCGFLVMNTERQVWRGKARWTHATTSGPEHERLNRKPMFRYNAYFGLHTVHHLDLVELRRERLSLPRIAAGVAAAWAAGRVLRPRGGERVLTPWAEAHLARPATLKFLAAVDGDGFPAIVPAVPCAAAGSRRLMIAATAHTAELAALAEGASVAVLALDLQLRSVLVRGRLARPLRGSPLAWVDIDWVYNSMPPKMGQIWPPQPVRAVEFEEV